MVTIKHTRDSIAKLEQERDQFKRERDSLIKDVENLREEKAATEMYLDAVKVYKPMYECVNDKYKHLTNYIKDKALHNPSVSRYIDLVHVIDGLERESVTMKNREYKDTWHKLKDELREMFIYGYHLEEGTPSKYMNEAYGIVFKKMCELDNTNDFSNLLDDMNREDANNE